MTFNIYSNGYPYENEYYSTPSLYYSPMYRRRRQQQQQQLREEQRRRQALQQRQAEITRARRIQENQRLLQKQQEEEYLKRLAIRKQKKEEYMRNMEQRKQQQYQQQNNHRVRSRQPVIIEGPDGSLYRIDPDKYEELERKFALKERTTRKNQTKMDDKKSTASNAMDARAHQPNNADMKTEKISQVIEDLEVDSKNETIGRSKEVEDASDDESEDFSINSRLYPSEGESWMQPIE